MIYNLSKKTIVARKVRQACGFFDRGRGMIGRRFDCFDAMLFEDCRAIHSCFMSISIDVIFVDSENKVLMAIPDLKPWRLLVNCPNARAVLELPAGTISKTQTSPGDVLDLRAEPSPDALKTLEKQDAAKLIDPSGARAISPLEETNR